MKYIRVVDNVFGILASMLLSKELQIDGLNHDDGLFGIPG